MLESHQSITERTRIKLPIAAWVSMFVMIGGIAATFAVAQHQIGAHERRLEKLESDRELLLRIDERTVEIKRQIERLGR